MSIRVLIADGDARFRQQVRARLESLPGLEVAGEAADANATLRQIQSLYPNVVIIDSALTGGCRETIQQIKKRKLKCRVLALAPQADDETLQQAGADGVIAKTSSTADFVRAIHRALYGQGELDSQAVYMLNQQLKSLSNLTTDELRALNLFDMDDDIST